MSICTLWRFENNSTGKSLTLKTHLTKAALSLAIVIVGKCFVLIRMFSRHIIFYGITLTYTFFILNFGTVFFCLF